MEGYYQNTQLSPQELQRQSSQNQFRQQMQPQQHQQSQQRPDVPSNEVQMMHDAINMARNASSGQPNGHGQESINNVDSAFDDMMRDNQNEHQRRRSMPQSFHSTLAQDSQNRRLSSIDPGEMMTFGNDGDLNSYQFNQNMSSGYPTLDTSNMNMGNHMGNYMTDPADFSISPDMMGSMIPSTFANMSMGNMGNNPSGMDLFSNNAVTSAPMASQFSTNSMGQISNDFSMDMSPDNAPLSATPSNAPHHMLGALEDGGENMLDMNSPLNPQMNAQLNQQMNAQLQQQMNSQLNQQLDRQMNSQLNQQLDRQMNQQMNNQMNQQMNQQMNNQMNQQINNQANNQMNRRTNSQIDQQANSRPNSQSNNQTNNQLNSQVNSQIDSNDPVVQHQPRPQPGMRVDSNMGNSSQTRPTPLSRHISSPNSVISPVQANSSSSIAQQSSSSDATTPVTNPTSRESKEKTIYSKSGFDMLKALWLVATRKNPQIHLGAVDMSCAFVVCDVQMNDCPIIYVSDNFQNLTGYSRHEIVGQNCRFLQAPDGQVEAGTKREFVDEGAVYNLKKMIQEGREVQQSLINYRKGGKPFLNLLTMIPIPWDTDEIRYFIGFQIDLVECPDAISSGQEMGGVKVNYKHSVVGQYIWTPPNTSQYESETGQTLGVDDVSTLLQQFSPKGMVSDWHKQSWDKMLLENADDVVHVLSLKGLFLYLSPACKRVLEYDATELVGSSLSSVCHPSDIVPVTRELKDTAAGSQVNIVFRIRRKNSGYTWFESHGSLFVEQGKGRKCIILVGRKRPVFALSRRNLEAHGGIGDSELWTKISTSGMFLYVSSNIRSLLDLQPEALVGTSIQELMRKESRPEFGRAIEKARRGRTVSCKHEVQNRRGQVLQAQTTLFPGDASDGQKPSFLLAQTKLLKASSRNLAPASVVGSAVGSAKSLPSTPQHSQSHSTQPGSGTLSAPAGGGLPPGSQDAALASDDNIFDELRTTKCSSWQFELRQMEKVNRILAEELGGLLANKKKRKRRKGVGNIVRDCANCHTRSTPEWRRGPSGQRDLCNSCGLRWAKQTGRVSPRNSSRGGNNGNGDSHSKKSASPVHSSPLHRETSAETGAQQQGMNGDGGVNPAHLTHQNPNPGGTAPSGASSAIGAKPSTTMPPPSQPMLSGGAAGSAMTSIREERETSQP